MVLCKCERFADIVVVFAGGLAAVAAADAVIVVVIVMLDKQIDSKTDFLFISLFLWDAGRKTAPIRPDNMFFMIGKPNDEIKEHCTLNK